MSDDKNDSTAFPPTQNHAHPSYMRTVIAVKALHFHYVPIFILCPSSLPMTHLPVPVLLKDLLVRPNALTSIADWQIFQVKFQSGLFFVSWTLGYLKF